MELQGGAIKGETTATATAEATATATAEARVTAAINAMLVGMLTGVAASTLRGRQMDTRWSSCYISAQPVSNCDMPHRSWRKKQKGRRKAGP
jgi:hypothetical protein